MFCANAASPDCSGSIIYFMHYVSRAVLQLTVEAPTSLPSNQIGWLHCIRPLSMIHKNSDSRLCNIVQHIVDYTHMSVLSTSLLFVPGRSSLRGVNKGGEKGTKESVIRDTFNPAQLIILFLTF